jgi:hypothetical protein
MTDKLHMTVFERVQAERDELRRQLIERDAIIADLRQKLEGQQAVMAWAQRAYELAQGPATDTDGLEWRRLIKDAQALSQLTRQS